MKIVLMIVLMMNKNIEIFELVNLFNWLNHEDVFFNMHFFNMHFFNMRIVDVGIYEEFRLNCYFQKSEF
jgi:hypothetical protein